MVLPVAFSWCEYYCTRLFEHRNEVRGDDGLSEQILAGAEEGRALPAPHVFLNIIIAPMTGPDGQMAVLQALGHFIWHRGVAHPRTTRIVDIAPQTIGVRIPLQTGGNQLADIPSARLDGQIVMLVERRHHLTDSIVDIFG